VAHRDHREPTVSITLNPYLNFPDAQAREAMELYQSVLGGELNVMTFGDMGTEGPLATQLMHAQLVTPGGITLMGADAPPEMVQVSFGDNVSVSLSGGPEDAEELRGWFAALSEGGQVRQPLEPAPWGDEFGMFVDRFGISWLVNIAGQSAS
jgi:PhnB protein